MKISGRHRRDLDTRRFLPAGQRHDRPRVTGDVRQRARAALQLAELGAAERRAAARPAAGILRRRDVLVEAHEPIGALVAERFQQHAVNHAENIAVVAPMPSASVTTATAVKPGVRASLRRA